MHIVFYSPNHYTVFDTSFITSLASDSEEKNYKKAAVITGSASDLPIVEEAVRMLKEYGSIIAAAGMTAHLSGNMRVYKDGQYIDPITFPRLFFA